MIKQKLLYGTLGLMLGYCTVQPALACTGTKVEAQDGTVLFGRTLEFGAEMHSNVILIPRNYQLVANASTEQNNLTWKSKYAVLGMNAESLPSIVEGVNEKGLRVGLFYFPGYAGFQTVAPNEVQNSLSSYDVGTWILTNFSSIDEVKAAIQTVKVSNAPFKNWGFVLPLHYIVSDTAGNSLIMEYVGGTLKMYDDTTGVFTNAPEYNWQKTNLNTYANLTPTEVVASEVPKLNLKSFGLGSGMLGLPGDFTSPSRYVRMSLFTATMLPVPDSQLAVSGIFHLLNLFDVPKGSSVEQYKGSNFYDYTQWTSVIDVKKRLLYFTTYNSRNIKMVDMSEFDLDAKDIKVIDVSGDTTIDDVSENNKLFTPAKP
ncbi:linear amide C-N hydrolase [Legionella bononiensis]|uniref:linear amide C-N hydrolase n=1 Tax=Legionella bononiensis TaxID=2793102 RepID=UPI0019315868|nr:choloylglycine hydrolase family protein [Legionella bononiensis]MBL7480610.1 choloylglycine hydrolase family protein [Legionella bononiensis]